MLEALALHFHRGEDQAVPYEMRGVSHSFASFKTGNTRIDSIMQNSRIDSNISNEYWKKEQNFISIQLLKEFR